MKNIQPETCIIIGSILCFGIHNIYLKGVLLILLLLMYIYSNKKSDNKKLQIISITIWAVILIFGCLLPFLNIL
jgi:hypothetical protein